MRKVEKYQGNLWPQTDDALLLKTIALPRHKAIEAWEEWLKIVDVDTLEAGTQRMFPLLYVKLKEYGINHSLMEKFQGIYRQTWYKNQMTFYNISPLLQAFKDEEIDTIVLKGAAMTVLYYKDLGLRHMSDFDLMVKPSDVKQTLSVLKKFGYETTSKGWKSFDNNDMLFTIHSASFKHAISKQKLDLHWHLIYQNCGLHDDDALWLHKQPTSINNISTNTLDGTYHLMHTCIHGLQRNDLVPIRWVIDAEIIITKSEIKWEQFINEVERRNIVFPIFQALSYLQDEFLIPIPEEVIFKLSSIKQNKIEYYDDIFRRTNIKESFLKYFLICRYKYLLFAKAKSGNNYAFLKPWMLIRFFKVKRVLVSNTEIIPELFRLGHRIINRKYVVIKNTSV